MEDSALLNPTLHVEVRLRGTKLPKQTTITEIRKEVSDWLPERYRKAQVGHTINDGFDQFLKHYDSISTITFADFTGSQNTAGIYSTEDVALDVQVFVLSAQANLGRGISQTEDENAAPLHLLPLPHAALDNDWDSLVFDDSLQSNLLRYLTRVVGLIRLPSLNLDAFNWNRLCLLHGPPGSGKSTLCRALAQKMSIRLADQFPKCVLAEINTNALLSKYFGESGRLVSQTFLQIEKTAQDRDTLVVVVMDEVESIAGSRAKASSGSECGDSLRATNQLLMAFDRVRSLPNVIVLCTSNLIDALDPAFLDRIDIKQMIPTPSPEAIYDIFRSSLNELVRCNAVSPGDRTQAIAHQPTPKPTTPTSNSKTRGKPVTRSTKTQQQPQPPPALTSPPLTAAPSESWNIISSHTILPFAAMRMNLNLHPDLNLHPNPETRPQPQPQPSRSPSARVWGLAQKCEGLSGRTLRRLPMLGLAMHTWGPSSLSDAVAALEAAVGQELMVQK